LHPLDDADTRHDAAADREVGAPRCQGGQFQERGVLVDQELDTFAREQLATAVVAFDVLLAATGQRFAVLLGEVGDAFGHSIAVRRVRLRRSVDRCLESCHAAPLVALDARSFLTAPSPLRTPGALPPGRSTPRSY